MAQIVPPEIIWKIIKFCSSRKQLRLVNKQFKMICDSIMFKFPAFTSPVPLRLLLEFPIQELSVSQIKGKISVLPESLNVVIIDVNFSLDLTMIKRNPDITFVFATHTLNGYHISNYMKKNTKIYTTAQSALTVRTLKKFQNLTFKTLTISHIETFPGSDVDLLEHLAELKIERLILDRVEKKFDPRRLVDFKNITYISSAIFKRYEEFPLWLISKLPSLEIIQFLTQTYLNFELFKGLKKLYVDKTPFIESEYTYLRLFHYPRKGRVRTRQTTSIFFKNLPSSWVMSLQDNVFPELTWPFRRI